MKKLPTILLLLALSSIAAGEVSTRVCLADGNTPLELADPNIPFVYRDIMVGTKLTIIVDSNVAENWSGGLYIRFTDRDLGVLSARDYNDITTDWEGSHFEAAGDKAWILDLDDILRSGFFISSEGNVVAGDWFILDYNAIDTGICSVDFYDYSVSWNQPVHSHVFSHVHTRDFNHDTRVYFTDLALFSLYWLETNCTAPDFCAGNDLNTDGTVDHNDLTLFTDYWLEKTQ